MADVFDIKHMNQVINSFCPKGETVLNALYAAGEAAGIIQFFGRCQVTEDTLLPADINNVIKVTKMKLCMYDVYIGYTDQSLIIAESDMETKYAYQFEEFSDSDFTQIKSLGQEITHKSIGKVFPLESIKEFKCKKGLFGAFRCTLEMENGTCFKFMLAKRAGLSNRMPEHLQNREKLVEVLKKYSK